MYLEKILIFLLLLYFIGVLPHIFASSNISPNTIVTSAYMNFVPGAICPYSPVTAYSYISFTHIGYPPIPQGVWFRSELEITAKRPDETKTKYINVPEKPFKRGSGLVLTWVTGKYHEEAWVYEYTKIVMPGQSGYMEVIYKTTGFTFYNTYHGATGTSIYDWPIVDGDKFITLDPGFCRK